MRCAAVMTLAIDTTVLVYAVGVEHPAREPCRWLIEAIGSGELEATTTVEVIQEFAHVRARRMGRDDAVRHARDFAELLAPLLTATELTLQAGLGLYASNEALGAFDAVFAAAAIQSNKTVVSADAAFATLPELEHLNPLAANFREQVAAAAR